VIGAGTESRAQNAALVMQRNRVELRSVFLEPAAAAPDVFPRSATLRWVLARMTPRAIAWTALTTVLARIPFASLLGSALFGRRK
jgi:hypothetical protein